jgi:hypothetical protein
VPKQGDKQDHNNGYDCGSEGYQPPAEIYAGVNIERLDGIILGVIGHNRLA